MGIALILLFYCSHKVMLILSYANIDLLVLKNAMSHEIASDYDIIYIIKVVV